MHDCLDGEVMYPVESKLYLQGIHDIPSFFISPGALSEGSVSETRQLKVWTLNLSPVECSLDQLIQKRKSAPMIRVRNESVESKKVRLKTG